MNYEQKMNLDYAGIAFTDETHSDVGASAFGLDHDCFFNDSASGDTLIIRTGAGGGGTLLVQDIDYTIGGIDTFLSAAEQTDKDTYSTIQIINVTYQSGALYFSGKYVGDYNDSADINQITPYLQSPVATATLTLHGYDMIMATAGANGIILTIPTAAAAYKNFRVKLNKIDAGTGCVTLLAATGTISGLSYIFHFEQFDSSELYCSGTAWYIVHASLTLQTGGINTNDWTNRELGDAVIPYDNAAGTALVIGEKVTNGTTPANTGIIVAKTATTLTLKKSTGTGIHADNNVLTGSMGGGTVLVNIPGSTSKNADSNFYHGYAMDARKLIITAWLYEGTTFQFANARSIDFMTGIDPANRIAVAKFPVDTNNIKIQTSTNGFEITIENGTPVLIAAQDYSYNIVTQIIF
jgi:hypothetical protein